MFSGGPTLERHVLFVRAPFCSARFLLSIFWAGFSMFSCISDRIFEVWEARCVFCLASQIHKGTYLLAPPDHQLRGKWCHQVDFPLPPGSLFGPSFAIFSYFSEFHDFVKIELPCRRELGFEGPGPFPMSLIPLGAPSKNVIDFGGS